MSGSERGAPPEKDHGGGWGWWDGFYTSKRNPWGRDSHDCKVGALAAGVKILLDVGTRQREGEVGKAAGSGVRAIWEKEGRKPFYSLPAMLGSLHDLSRKR